MAPRKTKGTTSVDDPTLVELKSSKLAHDKAKATANIEESADDILEEEEEENQENYEEDLEEDEDDFDDHVVSKADLKGICDVVSNLMKQQRKKNDDDDSDAKWFNKFKRLSPPEFKGAPNPDVAIAWLKKMEKFFKAMRCLDHMRVDLIAYVLIDEADNWWDAVRPDNDVEPCTWVEFKDLFYKQYYPNFSRKTKEKEFLNLKQEKMTVIEYAAKFIELSRFAKDYVSTEEKKAERFEEGLSWKIRDKLADCIFFTYDEVLQKASKVEAYIFEKEQYFNNKDQKKRKEFGRLQNVKPSERNLAKRHCSLGTNQLFSWHNHQSNCERCGRNHQSNECLKAVTTRSNIESNNTSIHPRKLDLKDDRNKPQIPGAPLMGNKSSIQSVAEVKSRNQLNEVSKGNDWADDAGPSTHNGWGASGISVGFKDQGWLDKPAESLHNGWGERITKSIGDEEKYSSCEPPPLEDRSNGWMDEAVEGQYQGWSSEPVKQDFNGWANEPVKDEYNGWEAPEPKHNAAIVNQDTQQFICPDDNILSLGPSAPPIPAEFLHEEVNYSPIKLQTKTHEAKIESDTSSCKICWESPVEGACVPCGHMAGCMSCLHEIKSKKGDCPICRVKIDQVIKLYAV